jgi:hypothetical protein
MPGVGRGSAGLDINMSGKSAFRQINFGGTEKVLHLTGNQYGLHEMRRICFHFSQPPLHISCFLKRKGFKNLFVGRIGINTTNRVYFLKNGIKNTDTGKIIEINGYL